MSIIPNLIGQGQNYPICIKIYVVIFKFRVDQVLTFDADQTTTTKH